LEYRIEIRPKVLKGIRRIPTKDREKIEAAIDDLANDPRPAGCEPVKTAEHGSYRIRVGRYRVAYLVRDDLALIMVMRVAKRDASTYRDLS
jgi:mRNA interferase RelE/StbE